MALSVLGVKTYTYSNQFTQNLRAVSQFFRGLESMCDLAELLLFLLVQWFCNLCTWNWNFQFCICKVLGVGKIHGFGQNLGSFKCNFPFLEWSANSSPEEQSKCKTLLKKQIPSHTPEMPRVQTLKRRVQTFK